NASYLVLDSAAGNDTVQIGSSLSGGLASILAAVRVENTPAYTNLVITNEGDSANRTWTIDSANGYGSLVGMAPATIFWKNADIASISLMCGAGGDTGQINGLSRSLSINNASGSEDQDNIAIGRGSVDSGTIQDITGGGITINNSPSFT